METHEKSQESMMQVEPQKEHHWLQKLVGEWTYESEVKMGPDQSSKTFSGTETVRSLNGLWVIAEARGEMPCLEFAETVMTLGYDPQKQRYIGTWIGSMMTYLWQYDGELDSAEQALTLHSTGPDMSDETKMTQYRDVIELKGDNQRVMASYTLSDDGQWTPFMTTTYSRKL